MFKVTQAFILFGMLVATAHGAKCLSGFTYKGAAKSCYRVVFERLNWRAAGERCRSLGSHLADITSGAKNSAVKQYVKGQVSSDPNNNPCMLEGQPAVGNMLWIDGEQQWPGDCNSPFGWKTLGKLFGFTSWAGGEPNCSGGGKMCVHLWGAADYNWNDHQCDMQICPLCEHKPF